MRSVAFLKKEIMQMICTAKIFILPGVLFVTGATSPLLAKYMPLILKMVSKSSEASGLTIKASRPKPYDACAELFNDLGTIGMIVIILVFIGVIIEEKLKGTATLVLTKTISRVQFVALKFISSIMLFTFSYIIMVVTFLVYSINLFPNFFRLNHLGISFFAYWLLGILVISITIFASTIGKSFTSAVLLAFIGFTVLSLTDYIPYVANYSPNIINSITLNIIKGNRPADSLIAPCIVTCILSLLFLFMSIIIFRKQENL